MRNLPRFAFASLLALGGGCSRSTSAPAAASAPATAPAAVSQPATVVLSGLTDAGRRLVAVSENGATTGQTPVPLTAIDVDAAFVAALPAHRGLLFEKDADGQARFVIIGADGSGRVASGALPANRYSGGAAVTVAADTVIVEAVRAVDARRDLFALGTTAVVAPRLLAEDVALVGASDERVAFLQGGNLKSVRLDGSALLSLGGGDGRDEVVAMAGMRGSRVLLTMHGAGKGDVRLTALDGSMHVDLGQPGAGPGGDEQAFALAPYGRVLFTRATAKGSQLVSGALDGSAERVLTSAELGATPRMISESGLVIVETAAGALLSVDSMSGALRTLDPAAGTDLVVGKITADRVIYTGTGALSPSLRAARLDGTGVTVLCEKPLWLPYFSALGEGGRVVFHRALSGQLEGGQSFSVNLDGSDLRPIGTDITAIDGSHAAAPFDQDFMAVTASGHVILEAEYEGLRDSQLLLAAPGTPVARELARLPGMRFAGLIP